MIDAAPINCDVAIIGAGISGALIAKSLAAANKNVVILEAGPDTPTNLNEYLGRFYQAHSRGPEVPYPPDVVDGKGNVIDPAKVPAGRPASVMLWSSRWKNAKTSYLIQDGPLPFSSSYERLAGGTTRHWLGTCLRMLPADFRMQSLFGRGLDWPLDYSSLMPWYEAAEYEIGVAANIEEQANRGIPFSEGYQYPMPGIPLSVTDQLIASHITGMQVKDLEGIQWQVTATPAARNSRPFRNRRACAGNSSCVPICPIQAKYDASITLNEALNTGRVRLLHHCVASDIEVDPGSQRVRAVHYKTYDDAGKQGPQGIVRAGAFVLAANAIETPRLMLLSANRRGIGNRNGLVGQNLMDHPYYVVWGLLPESQPPVWPYRGPQSTGGIESARDGAFRGSHAAFRMEIGNDGWSLLGDPYQTALDIVLGVGKHSATENPLFGAALSQRLNAILTRQVRMCFLIEQLPEPTNAVRLANEVDGLGLPRPRIRYDLSDYTKAGFLQAKATADALFQAIGAEQLTAVGEDDPSKFSHGAQDFSFYGAGHICGTCRMGSSKDTSVVNQDLRSWDHENLFVAGSSVFPTIGTSNPTLTLAALSLRLADHLSKRDFTVPA